MKKMIYGVDLGWVSQLEAMGYRWLNEAGKETDILEASKELGANAVRLRIFVNPPKEAFWQKQENETCMLGFCDAPHIVQMAERIKKSGMKLMVGFHYSDHFADPEHQDIPEEWLGDSDTQLEKRIYGHTREVMRMLKEHHASPDWVQVGNEINNGILWPRGSLKEAPGQLVRFLNAGYDAVKEVSQESQVITHLASVLNDGLCMPFLENFFAENGRTDILGFSYYPYWEKFESDQEVLAAKLREYARRYRRPVMIAEVGGLDYDGEGTYQIVSDCIGAMRKQDGQEECGVFYWEPEVTAEILPDAYPLGAAKLVGEKTLQYNQALRAYREC